MSRFSFVYCHVLCLQTVLDGTSVAVSEFLSRLPEETEGAASNTAPLSEQVELLGDKDEGFVVPTQVRCRPACM